MKVALFGGTFDPVHTGHLLIAESARGQLGLDRVIFLPTAIPPHKRKPKADARHRLAMLRLAIRGNPAFEVSDWELSQKRIVYTYESLDHFAPRFGGGKCGFIVGSDSLSMVPHWRRGPELLKRVRFLAVERPGTPWNRLPARLRRRARLIASPTVPFSSADIRRRMRRRQSVRYQVPEAVERYMRRHRLYRAHA